MFWKTNRTKPTTKWDMFISYAHEDKKYVLKLVKELKGRGLEIWYDELEMEIGKSIIDSISDGLKESILQEVID